MSQVLNRLFGLRPAGGTLVGTLDPRIEPGQVMSVTGPSGWGNQWCWVRGGGHRMHRF